MLILIWFIVCILFAFVHYFLGTSGHALELFALLSAIALFLLNKFVTKLNKKNEKIFSYRESSSTLSITKIA